MPETANELDFGRYHVQRLLGRGGMGEVYLARDTDLERDVAIKFVSSAKLQDPEARARLLREAQAAAGLDHPCICAVHEAGLTPDGRAYIVMPYVEGTLLSDLIRKGPMSEREALGLCAQMADALATAHRRGIVHRDLKPGNVIVSPSGRPRLLDFGIAQSSIVPHAIAEAPTVTLGENLPTPLVGTPSYMSPEQAQRRPIDGRSDLFSLGVVLYECLTGSRAFDGATPYEAVANILRVNPLPPSHRVPTLTDRHDALCARLMAKDPNDRFQSAEEVVGAIRILLPDTGRITGSGTHPIPPMRARGSRVSRVVAGAGIAVVVTAAAFGVWRWTRGSGLPPVPADADGWYRRGTEALRDGAYQSARGSLQRAVDLFPQHALAYARLAEADTALDDERAAQMHLLRLSSIVPDESRLPRDEQLRVRAVRALVLRDVDTSVSAYRELVDRHPDDAGALVDLGQVQDAAGLRDDARASFERGIAVDPEYAAAYLQLGSVEGAALRLDKALAAFGQAERLYQAASNTEGETEVLLRRGAALDASGEVRKARVDLEQALKLAAASKAASQEVRARLTLSSVTATQGQFSEAQQMATSAVQEATAAGLDTVAADGLIDLTATLVDRGQLADAEVQIQRAVQLADDRGAKRTTVRARIELAELRRGQDKPAEALLIVSQVLPFVRAGHYRRFELFALLIAARAHQQLGQLEQAREMSSGVLTVAESLKDEGRIALAGSDLAAITTALGRYPEALRLRERAEDIYRRQGDQSQLPYTLANHADLLIRLGRPDDALRPLSELDAGIKAGLEAYAGRARRAAALRGFAAATALRCDDALRFCAKVQPQPDATDSASLTAQGVSAYCDARQRRPSPALSPLGPDADPILVADRAYWLAAAALVRGDVNAARIAATDGLAKLADVPNDELRWRLATAGEVSAARLKDAELKTKMEDVAHDAMTRLQASWKEALGTYLSRADLVDLRKRAAQ
jgi:tetratricopeptide (TPR) repeat protein